MPKSIKKHFYSQTLASKKTVPNLNSKTFTYVAARANKEACVNIRYTGIKTSTLILNFFKGAHSLENICNEF